MSDKTNPAKGRWRTPWPIVLQWGAAIGFGIALGALLGRLHLPAAAMVGPIIVGLIMAQRGTVIRVPLLVNRLSQGAASCLIALYLDAGMLSQTLDIWPTILVFVCLTFAVSCLTGVVVATWTRLDRELTVWGFLPGMMGAVVLAAYEKGLNGSMVAFIQMLRLMSVIAVMVAVTAVLSGPATPHSAGVEAATLVSTLTGLGLCVIGVAIAKWLPFIPAGASLGPLFLAAVLKLSGISVAMPEWLVTVAFWAIGIQVGLGLTVDLLRQGWRALPGLMAGCLLLILLCAVSGIVLARIAGVDIMSGLLATVPGSIDSIALLAISADADVSFVMTLQTVRLFAVATLGPLLAASLSRFIGSRMKDRAIKARE